MQDSCLSPNVKYILCDVCKPGSNTNNIVALNKQGLLHWNVIQDALPNYILPEEEDSDYFVSCVKCLSPILNNIHQVFSNLDNHHFNTLATRYLTWTSEPKVLRQCFHEIQNDPDVGTIQAVLLCTSILERSLGDLYLLKGKQCPSMLKDLLLTKELRDILGPTPLHVLRVLIGPPISLNLRNVLWHGFPHPGEIHPQYFYVLLAILMSIGEILEDSGISADHITHRTGVTFPQITCMAETLLSGRSITPEDLDDVEKLFRDSSFVQPCMVDLWTRAVHMYREHRYGECVVVLLPLLEHGLRREFTSANNCPHRILTAESTVLFTTLDEILSADLENGSESRLRYNIGDHIMSILLDMFSYPCGPRLRDRVSHGESSIEHTPVIVAEVLLSVCVLCAALRTRVTNTSIVKHLKLTTERYNSLYHPIALVQSQILKAAVSLEKWREIKKPDSGSIESCSEWPLDGVGVCTESIQAGESWAISSEYHGQHLNKCVLMPFQPLVATYTTYQQQPIDTLYRNTTVRQRLKEEELVGILSQITHQMFIVSEQTLNTVHERYEQYQRKELRSRQRKTYARMLDSIPVLSGGLRLALYLCTMTLYTLDDVDSLGTREKHIKLFKSLLQYTELLTTYTHSDRNRWDEASTLTLQVIQKVKQVTHS